MRYAVGVACWGLLASNSVWAATCLPVPTHVACVGDSITMGAATTYPGDLQGLLGPAVQVQGFGHSGATMLSTGDVPYRQTPEFASATDFVSKAGDGAVVDVIIMLGTNDTKPYNWTSSDGGMPVDQFRADCAAMVDHFAQLPTHPRVFLALPPTIYPNGVGISAATLDGQIKPIIKQVAASKAVPVIDVNAATQNRPELFSDGVHPNDQGYALIAQVMRDGLLGADAAPPVQPDGGPGDADVAVVRASVESPTAAEESASPAGGCSCRTGGRRSPPLHSLVGTAILMAFAKRRRRP